MISNVLYQFIEEKTQAANDLKIKSIVLKVFLICSIYACLLLGIFFFARDQIIEMFQVALGAESADMRDLSDGLILQMAYFTTLFTTLFFTAFYTNVVSVILFSTASISSTQRVSGTLSERYFRFYFVFFSLLSRYVAFGLLVLFVSFVVAYVVIDLTLFVAALLVVGLYVVLVSMIRVQTDLSMFRCNLSVVLACASLYLISTNMF